MSVSFPSFLRRRLVPAAAAATLLVPLTACSDDGSAAEPANAVHTASNGDVYSDADIAFATEMIPHHAQALVMVDLTRDRKLSPKLTRVAEGILTAQGPEIELMTDWLTAWGEPVPETMRDHANAHGEGQLADSDMPGMLTAAELEELETAKKAVFEERWLELMIEHHEGAIEMAQQEQEDGEFDPAVELAEGIESSQQREIDKLAGLLGS